MARAASRLFRIQYVSDLHLEFYDKAVFPLLVKPTARFLALAGDIGKPHNHIFKSFLEYVSTQWDHVFYVAGNHEYYTHHESISEIQDTIKSAVAPYKNIHYLSKSNPSFYFPEENVAILGTTLWTHIPDEMQKEAKYGMNDFKLISQTKDARLTPSAVSDMHRDEYKLLETQINYWGARDANVVVITHHMPSYKLISPRYAASPLNCCFASNCEALFQPWVRAWIYGHTHNASTGVLGSGTIAAINARGYPHERVPGFTTQAWLEFPCRDPASERDETLPEMRAAAATD
jgi:predicted phosphodiesterase